MLATAQVDRYENEIEFLREGNVKGPLEMDSRSGFALQLASRAVFNKLTITFYWEVQMMNCFLGVKLDSKGFPTIYANLHETL